MLGRTMSALGTEELSDIFTSFSKSKAGTDVEKERAMKRKFAAEVKKAQLAKELAMAKKNRYRKKH